MTDVDTLWLRTLEELGDRAAHEIKDTLNGVSLSLEVVRGRSTNPSAVSDFAATAADQLELVTARVDAMLALARRPREPADVSATLKRLAAILVPAARADGGSLQVEGLATGDATLTRASGQVTRLALAAALLALLRKGGRGSCHLEAGGAGSGQGAVVRFSHESAGTCSLDPDVEAAIAQHEIRVRNGGPGLQLVFPAYH